MAVIIAAVIGAVATGASAYMSSQSAKSAAKKRSAVELQLPGLQGAEERKTAAFKAQLIDYYQQKERYQKSLGLANWSAAAKGLTPNPRFSALNAMANFKSPNVIKDPGAPPTPPQTTTTPAGNAPVAAAPNPLSPAQSALLAQEQARKGYYGYA